MSTLIHYEDRFKQPDNEALPENKIEIITSNFHGEDQVYLRVTDKNNSYKTFLLSKKQLKELQEGLHSAGNRIGYFD